MGFWGTFVLARTEAPIDERAVVEAVSDGALRVDQIGPWQSCMFEEAEIWDCRAALLRDLVAMTDAPAVVGFVLDGDCLWVRGLTPAGADLRVCVARQASADYLEEDDLTLDQCFASADQAVDRAIAWSREADLSPDTTILDEMMHRQELDPGTGASVWSALLAALGVVAN